MENKELEQLLTIVSVLKDNLDELEDWSVANDEVYLELVQGMKKIADLIETDAKEDYEQN